MKHARSRVRDELGARLTGTAQLVACTAVTDHESSSSSSDDKDMSDTSTDVNDDMEMANRRAASVHALTGKSAAKNEAEILKDASNTPITPPYCPKVGAIEFTLPDGYPEDLGLQMQNIFEGATLRSKGDFGDSHEVNSSSGGSRWDRTTQT